MQRWSSQRNLRLSRQQTAGQSRSPILTLPFAILFASLTLLAQFGTSCSNSFSNSLSAQIILGDRDDNEIDDELERSLKDTLVQKEQSVFIPTPREILRPLFRADRAIKERDITGAVSLLGEVLSDSTSEDYLVPVKSSVEGVSTSLRLRAQAILGALPRKDRQLYRLRYGVQAKKMLEKAIAENDFNSVSQVMQRFFFTDAGFDAAMLLGHFHLDEGRPIAAANCFSRITGSPEGRAIHDPEASVLLATCWMLGDSSRRAEQALIDLKKTSDQTSIEFMGRPVQLFSQNEEAIGWLQKLIGDSPLREIEMVNQWVMSGGNPQRNARSGTGFPLLSPRWSTVTLNDPDLEDSVTKRQKDLIYLKSAPIPAVQPLAVGDTIVMRAFDRMIGVDFKTGKRVWVFPPADFTANVAADDANAKPRTLPKLTLTERLWLDSIYGQASSDGKRIFVVPKPGFSRQAARVGTLNVEPLLQREYNELKAVDIERQGAFVWEVGGETGLDEPKLAKTLFLGAPLPLGGELFAVCRNESEILLVVLDAQTGKMNWSQRLGTTETSLQLANDRRRRLAGATPSFADGIVVCSTGTGALVGIDLATRSLLWGYQYTSPGKKEVQPISPGMLSNSDPLTGLWRDSAITIADGKVLFTPVDSQDLICVDLQNGFPGYLRSNRPTSKSPRGDALFVACVENGLTILQGETNVRAISLQTGNPVWNLDLREYGKPSGRGYSNRGCYFFPTTSKHLVQVDLKTGKLVKAVGTDGVLGNLVCHKGDVLSHGVDRLSTYPQDEPNRQRIALAEQQGELSHELLALKAQLQVQDGDLRGAIESIESAFEQSPNRTYQRLLLDLVLQMMDSDFEFGLELAERHVDALLAQRKFEYLTAKIGGLIRAQKYDDSINELFGLLNPIEEIQSLRQEFIEVSSSRYDPNSESVLQQPHDIVHPIATDDQIRIRLDRWIASRIELISDKADNEQNKKLAGKVNELTTRLIAASVENQASDSKTLDLYETLKVFPHGLLDSQVRFELFSRLVTQGETLRAAELLRLFNSLTSNEDQQFAGQANALMAEHLIASGLPGQALTLAAVLNASHRDTAVSGEITGGQFAESIREQAAIEPELPLIQQNLKFNQVETISATTSSIPALTPCRIILQASDDTKYFAYQFRFLQQTGEFIVNDADGKEIYKFDARQEQKQKVAGYNQFTTGRISIKNDLAVVDIAREMFVFDLLRLRSKQAPVLWYKGLPDGQRDSSIRSVSDAWGEIQIRSESQGYERRVFVGPPRSDVICYLDAPHLIAVDARTGETVWQRPSNLPGSVVYGDDHHIVIWNATKRVAKFYSPADGRLLATRNLPPEAGTVWQPYGTRVLVSGIRTAEKADSPTAPGADTSKRPTLKSKRLKSQIKTLGLFDLFTEKMIWEKEFLAHDASRKNKPAMACRIGQDRIVILPAEGDLQFIDVKTGDVDFTTPIRLDRRTREDVDGIGVAVKSGKYLVHLKRGYCPTRTSLDELGVNFLYVNYSELTWFGTLICVDSQTGADLWKDHVRFDYFQIGQGTPYNTPIYPFLRRFNNTALGNPESQCQVLGINIETGEQTFNSLIAPMSGYQAVYKFTNDSANQQLTLEYSGNRTDFKMSYADDLPPSPVAHLLKQNAIPKSVIQRVKYTLDTELIKAEQKKMLQKALDSQKLLADKRAQEKRLLEDERKSNR